MSNTKTFEEFFTANYKLMLYYSSRILGNALFNEDIVTDAFLEAFGKGEQTWTTAYLRVSVRNGCLNRLKALRVRAKHNRQLEYLSEVMQDDLHWEESGRILALYRNMDKLPADLREMMQELMAGKSKAAVARKLGLPANTLQNRYNTAVRLLRDIWRGINTEAYRYESFLPLIRAGLSTRQIAVLQNCSVRHVYDVRYELKKRSYDLTTNRAES